MKWLCKFIVIGLILVFILFVVLIFLSYITSQEKPLGKPISKDIFFYHFSQERQNESIELKTGEKFIESINPKLPWKFFIHGWLTSPTTSKASQAGKVAYLHKGEYNVVFVDWFKLANQSLSMTMESALDVGITFGEFIIYLNHSGVSLDNIHLIGESMGSHVAGYAGKYVRDNLRKIGRITGLDPAGGPYESNSLLYKGQITLEPEKFRLSKEDANFVDIIHTDAADRGILLIIGHCDFFPNGGKGPQPGCENSDDENCNHLRSGELFVESINSNNFVAKECTSYEDYENDKCKNGSTAVMGEYTDSNTRGIFFLKTNSAPPFGLGNI